MLGIFSSIGIEVAGGGRGEEGGSEEIDVYYLSKKRKKYTQKPCMIERGKL